MSAQGEQSAPTVAQPGQPTEYVILERSENETLGWVERGTVTARDATQAIKTHLKGETDVDSQFVATPARSWKPVVVRTRVALDFGEPS